MHFASWVSSAYIGLIPNRANTSKISVKEREDINAL
jgi:hypothetical protein